MVMLTPDAHERGRLLVQRIDELEKTVAALREGIASYLADPEFDVDILLDLLEVDAW